MRWLTLGMGLLGVYHQYTAILTLLMGLGLIKGDWRASHRRNVGQVYMLEPVVEAFLQFLIQSALVYIVLGPGDTDGHTTPIDISSLLFTSTPFSKVLYGLTITSSLFSVGVSISK